MKFDAGAYVMISRDGPYLQYVLFQERPLERPFLYARKRLTADMLPQEAAQIIIDDLSSDPMVANFTVIENAPAVIDDHDGFRLLFRYRDPKGLTLKTAYYGFIQGQNSTASVSPLRSGTILIMISICSSRCCRSFTWLRRAEKYR